MKGNMENTGGRRGSLWRLGPWAVGATILLLPLVAMQFTDEVNWTVSDFVFAGILVIGTGIALELTVWKIGNAAYRAAAGIALAAAFILVWLSASVGIIGADGDPANLIYFGVLAVGISGAIIARFQPDGMARTLVMTALAQALAAAIALIAGWGAGDPLWPLDIVGLTVGFVALWLVSAWLFRKAARGEGRT